MSPQRYSQKLCDFMKRIEKEILVVGLPFLIAFMVDWILEIVMNIYITSLQNASAGSTAALGASIAGAGLYLYYGVLLRPLLFVATVIVVILLEIAILLIRNEKE